MLKRILRKRFLLPAVMIWAFWVVRPASANDVVLFDFRADTFVLSDNGVPIAPGGNNIILNGVYLFPGCYLCSVFLSEPNDPPGFAGNSFGFTLQYPLVGDPLWYNGTTWFLYSGFADTVEQTLFGPAPPGGFCAGATNPCWDISVTDESIHTLFTSGGLDGGTTLTVEYASDIDSSAPEPSTLLMIGTGLIGLGGRLKRKFFS